MPHQEIIRGIMIHQELLTKSKALPEPLTVNTNRQELPAVRNLLREVTREAMQRLLVNLQVRIISHHAQ